MALVDQTFTGWSLYGGLNETLVTDTVKAPDGTQTAALLTDDSVNTQHAIYYFTNQTDDYINGFNYIFTCYFKFGGHQYVELISDDNQRNGFSANFDILNGTVQSTYIWNSASLTGASIQAAANGWWLCSVSGILTTSGLDKQTVGIAMVDNGLARWWPSYAGSGTSIYMWSPDLVQISNVFGTSVAAPPTSSLVGETRIDGGIETHLAL